MITAIHGPLIVEPEIWTLVFSREASTWWASWLAFGRYKHVRAYAYVPFLHVWVFYDPHLRGTNLIVAADGAPAQTLIAQWSVNADLVRMRRARNNSRNIFPRLWCVGAMKALLGLGCVVRRPDALYRYCLRNGGQPFEGMNERDAAIQTAAA